MKNDPPLSKWDDSYLLFNPALYIDVNNLIRINASNIQDTEKLKKAERYVLSDHELILLYWAKKKRSISFIQNQLQADNGALNEIIAKLEGMGIVQIMPLNNAGVSKEFNLRSLWEKALVAFPDNTYILDRNDNTSYTYIEFDQVVRYITSTLVQNNIGKGDKIILHADINFEAMGLFWACMHLGVVFMPVNSLLAEIVVERLIEKYNPKAIFLSHDAGFRKRLNDKVVFFYNDAEAGLTPDKLFFSAWLKERGEVSDLPEINENDLGVILHTSGSTGVPKGVKLAHGQLAQSVVNLVKEYLWTERDNFLATNDLDSIMGFRGACIATAEVGATCVIPTLGEKTNPVELLACISETETTCISTSPSLLNQLLNKKDVRARLSKIRYIISGGSALTTQLKVDFFEKTGKRICNCYGLTETAGLTIGEPLNSTNEKGDFIGYPVDCIIKIVDDNNNNVKIGEIGELLLYGYTIFKGYYSDNEPKPNDVQQWFVTGDLVRLNHDGSIELMGRKKDFMKNARGEIVYFSEIEEALAPLPFIKDIGVIAFFSAEAERGALFVVLDDNLPTSKNIVEEIKKQITITIGGNKIPSVIKVIENIPRNKYGKLLKTELSQYI